MDKNFIIDGGVAIDVEGQLHDLHNLYDFKELNIDVITRDVSLLFVANAQAESGQLTREKVLVIFKEVKYFEFSKNFVSNVTCDLEEIGYKNPDDINVDWLLDESESVKSDHIFFRFSNDEFIRVYSKMAYCATH